MLTNNDVCSPFYKRPSFPIINGKVIKISPDYFIQKAAKYMGLSVKQFHKLNNTNKEKIKIYADLMATGVQFPMPYIDMAPRRMWGVQGIHRALAAKKNGIKKIPVFIKTR